MGKLAMTRKYNAVEQEFVKIEKEMDQLRIDQTVQLDQMLQQVLQQTSTSAATLTTGGHISTATAGSPILPATNPTSQQPLQTGPQQISQPQSMSSSSTGASVPTTTQQTIPQPMGPSSTGISAMVPMIPTLSSHTSNPPPTMSQQSPGRCLTYLKRTYHQFLTAHKGCLKPQDNNCHREWVAICQRHHN
jgi:hypothetical protein